LIGTIYAPYADLDIAGNGGVSGAVVGKEITVSGSGEFHFDEALLGHDNPEEAFRLVRWVEIKP
jgi:hypothetical protein